MQAWSRSWRGGTALAAGCLLVGLVRIVSAPLDALTVIAFLVAAGYAVAAVTDRRAETARQRAAGPSPWIEHGHGAAAPVTITAKDRVGALLATVAAVVGLVLVMHDREAADHDTPSVGEMSMSPG